VNNKTGFPIQKPLSAHLLLINDCIAYIGNIVNMYRCENISHLGTNMKMYIGSVKRLPTLQETAERQDIWALVCIRRGSKILLLCFQVNKTPTTKHQSQSCKTNLRFLKQQPIEAASAAVGRYSSLSASFVQRSTQQHHRHHIRDKPAISLKRQA